MAINQYSETATNQSINQSINQLINQSRVLIVRIQSISEAITPEAIAINANNRTLGSGLYRERWGDAAVRLFQIILFEQRPSNVGLLKIELDNGLGADGKRGTKNNTLQYCHSGCTGSRAIVLYTGQGEYKVPDRMNWLHGINTKVALNATRGWLKAYLPAVLESI
jgi:hypothetical protein